ncbi:hypothetical protein [Spiroplasma endosymbiont of Tiphia femorata]|uniref:hypothetical protein n=1 Tax=Spiroplasma endosymbiont of Tiphia femorata TaxID=3066326 RepID=UPI0030D3974A
MPWYGYVLLVIGLIMIIYPILITIRNVKILKRVGSYIISAPPRTGKSALACFLAQTHKKRVVSPFPIKLKNGYSYLVNYNDVFTFNQLASNYAFEEQDLIILDELALKINSNDLGVQFKNQQESLGQFCKLIGHMFNGTMYLIEQYPNRIPVQAREKVEYVVQVKRMRFLGFVVIFNLNLYTNIEDYNKVVFSRRRTKKMIKKGIMPPSYSGEAMAMTLFFPRHWLKRYNSRALHYVHELKSELSPKKYLKEASSIDMTYSDIKFAGLDKLDNILKKKDKLKNKDK